MDSWIFQGGYPLISVADRRRTPRPITLSQRRFLYTAGRGPDRGADGGERWAVPVNLRASVGGVVQRQRLLRRRRPAPRSTSTARSTGWSSTTGPGASTGSTTTPDLLAPDSPAGPGHRVRPARAHGAGGRLLGRGGGGHAPISTNGSAWSKPSATRTTPTCGPRSAAPSGLLDLIATDRDDRAALQAFVRRVAGTVLGPPGLGSAPGRIAAARHHRGPGAVRPGAARQTIATSRRRRPLARFRAFLADRSGLAAGPADPGRPRGGGLGRRGRLERRSWSGTGPAPPRRTRCAT